MSATRRCGSGSVRAASGKVYQLCLLDTNALSEIVKHPTVEGRGFVQRFPPSEWVPCWTVYNLVELRRSSRAYQPWLSFFGVYPSFLLKPENQILDDEIANYDTPEQVCVQLNAFSPAGRDCAHHLGEFIDGFFSDPRTQKIEKRFPTRIEAMLEEWLSRKAAFSPRNEAANAVDADRYVDEVGAVELCLSRREWVQSMLRKKQAPDIARLPSLHTVLYSQYYRLFDGGWSPRAAEVTDVLIAAAAPYMDAVVTERFQAGIFRKIRGRVRGMDATQIYSLADLR